MIKFNSAKIVGSFGVAAGTYFASSLLQAEVMDLTWNGGQTNAVASFQNTLSTAPITQNLDQIPGDFDFAQWNDLFGGTGRTFALFSSMAPPGILSLREAYFGQPLDPTTFVGNGAGAGTQFDGSGSAFIGFRSAAGNTGWFKIDFVTAGTIVYSIGQIGLSSETVFVGGETVQRGDVNCDGIISLLDIDPFVEVLISGKFDTKADINSDNEVNLLDVQPLVDLISGS